MTEILMKSRTGNKHRYLSNNVLHYLQLAGKSMCPYDIKSGPAVELLWTEFNTFISLLCSVYHVDDTGCKNSFSSPFRDDINNRDEYNVECGS